MSDNQGKKRKKKAYYKNFKKQKVESKLDAGQKGFLITCNFNEKQAVREAYNLLNEYGDKLYGPEQDAATGAKESEESGSEEDVEAAVAKELTAIRKTTTGQPRFRQRRSGANNVVFISTTVDGPTALIQDILTDVEASGQSKSRAILRMVPVECTCRAKPDDIKVAVRTVVERLLSRDVALKYNVGFKTRNSGDYVDRQSVIDVVKEVMHDHNASHRLDWHNYDILFNLDVIRTVCCIGLLKDYDRFRKYNLQEIASKQKKYTEVKSVKNNEDEKCKVQSDDTEEKSFGNSKEAARNGATHVGKTEVDTKSAGTDAGNAETDVQNAKADTVNAEASGGNVEEDVQIVEVSGGNTNAEAGIRKEENSD